MKKKTTISLSYETKRALSLIMLREDIHTFDGCVSKLLLERGKYKTK
ncbi:MAG: hypothetical protein R6U15_03720 [Candidatus Izemoplasmatales bacterium]